MSTFYVATRAAYVLVDANDETHARELGLPALAKLFREQLGKDVPVQIHTVRLASGDEIATMRWHETMLARERCSRSNVSLYDVRVLNASVR